MLVHLGILYQQSLVRLNIGSTLLSFALPLLMLQSGLTMLYSGSIKLAQAR
jgi:hypothetical protein